MTLEQNLTAAFQAVGADVKRLDARLTDPIEWRITTDGSGGYSQAPATAEDAAAKRSAGRTLVWVVTTTSTRAAILAHPGYLPGADLIDLGSEQRVYVGASSLAVTTVPEWTENLGWATPESDTLGFLVAGYLFKVPAGCSGVFGIDWQIGFANNTTGVRSCILKKRAASGAESTLLDKPAIINPADYTIVSGTTIVELLEGDGVFLSLYQNSGTALGVGRSHFRMVRVAP